VAGCGRWGRCIEHPAAAVCARVSSAWRGALRARSPSLGQQPRPAACTQPIGEGWWSACRQAGVAPTHTPILSTRPLLQPSTAPA
jgi:hypothetical protein